MTSKARPRPSSAAFWPWQHSLQYRILFVYGAVFLATLVLLVIWIADAVYRADLEAGEHELEVTAFLAANALEDPLSGYKAEFEKHERTEQSERDDIALAMLSGLPTTPLFPRLQQVTDRYARDAAAIVTIYNPFGDIVAGSDQRPQFTIEEVQQPELQGALSGSSGGAVRTALQAGEPFIFAAAPIKQSNSLLGFVQVSKPVSAVTADAYAVLVRLALASLLALAVATAFAVWIGRRLVRPLRTLEEAAFAVADGDLSQTVAVTSLDEVGALGSAFNYMVAQVRSTLEQQRSFIANASHELRTPLTNIKLRSEALRSLGAGHTSLEQRYLMEIEGEADRLTRLANDLLDLARLEEAQLPAGEAADITPCLREIIDIMQLRAKQAGVTLQAQMEDGLPNVWVSAGAVETVAANLLDNALKYTPRGGSVWLRALPAAGAVELRFEDDGPGIPSEDLPHIFDRFYRVDKARSRRKGAEAAVGSGSGAGLGLAIVRKLVEQNGGQIRVEPAPGQGTVFVVSFPAVA